MSPRERAARVADAVARCYADRARGYGPTPARTELYGQAGAAREVARRIRALPTDDDEPDHSPRPCGCVPCRCEDPERCHGCGAHRCDEHARESRESQRMAEDAERRQRGQEATEVTRLRARVAELEGAGRRLIRGVAAGGYEAEAAYVALAAALAERTDAMIEARKEG